MKEEIKVGVEFLRQFLAKYGNNLHQAQIDLFALKLQITLEERYVNHWYDAIPMKGQAFRCLRVKRSENYIDPVLEKLLFDLKLNLNQLGLPNDFTLWIDPGEVSVRFGDQVGYMYTIARLNTSIQTASINSLSPSTSSASSEQTTAKPCLVVQNAEKILFDEKLTDFIRQNSCNNTNDEYLTAGAPFNNEFTEDESKLNDLVIDELIKLSAEKRTISPPHAAISSPSSSSLTQNNSAQFLSPKSKEIKRQNSSNIAIVNKNSKDYDPTKSAIITNNNPSNFNSNRLSFNDSCYYSSSSSSCASSFESNDEKNLMMHQFGWFQNNNNNNGTADHTSSKTSCSNFTSFYNYDQSQQSESLPFSQGSSSLFSDQHSSFIQPSSFGFSSFGNDITNNSINSQTLYSNFEQYNNNKLNYLTMASANIYSDASSERSDTPNSCITSNSSFLMIPSSISMLKETTYDSSVVFMDSNSVKTDLNNTKSLLNVVGSPVNSSSSSSTASDVSTKTTIAGKNLYTNSIEDDDLLKQEEQIENSKMDMIVEASIDEASKICKSNSSSPAPLSPNSEKKTDQAKKEESYCGYVESFPYYYKLNRLYNALAVQKMQTERLRKTGIFNNNSNSSSLSTTPNPASAGTTPNQSNANLMRNLNSNSPKPLTGTSPSQFVMNRIGNSSLMSAASPSSSPSMKNSVLNSTSPPAVNINKNFHSRINNNIAISPSTSTPSFLAVNSNFVNNNNNNATSPVARSPSNSFNNMSKIQSMPKQNFKPNIQQQQKQSGYPMSPTNAAISYANHQNKNNNMNRMHNFNQQSRLYSGQQQHQPFQQQQQQQMIQSSQNSSILFDANLNNPGTNNLFPLIQQQQHHHHQQHHQQQQQQQQQQQEIINNLFNQMNLIRSQDLLKSKN